MPIRRAPTRFIRIFARMECIDDVSNLEEQVAAGINLR